MIMNETSIDVPVHDLTKVKNREILALSVFNKVNDIREDKRNLVVYSVNLQGDGIHELTMAYDAGMILGSFNISWRIKCSPSVALEVEWLVGQIVQSLYVGDMVRRVLLVSRLAGWVQTMTFDADPVHIGFLTSGLYRLGVDV